MTFKTMIEVNYGMFVYLIIIHMSIKKFKKVI